MPSPICTPEQKERLLAEAGVGVMLVVRFARDFARTPAEQFVREFLWERLAVREVHVGESFTFGHRREGDLALLVRLGAELGFAALGAPEVMLRGERISSTRIRRAVAEGRVEDAAEMLGRGYCVTGKIVRGGDRMGQRLGWPTANVATDPQLLPADGVYASRVLLPSFPATFDSATNIGTRPTVYENYQRVVESHLLDFKADVYGQRVELTFCKRLREERIFPTVMDLSAQIGRDVEATREYFSRRRLEQEGRQRVADTMTACALTAGIRHFKETRSMASSKVVTVSEASFESDTAALGDPGAGRLLARPGAAPAAWWRRCSMRSPRR